MPVCSGLILVDQLLAPLIEAGVAPTIFAEVEANPSVATVHAGVVAAAAAGCDAVVAIGGGSPIDAGKAMAMLRAYVADRSSTTRSAIANTRLISRARACR